MSAGFNVGDKVFWGTNGAIEAYVEIMANEAAERLGPGDPLTVFFQDERTQFYMGKVVFLDEWVAEAGSRWRLLELLDAASTRLLQSETFSEYGREWVTSVMAELHAAIEHDVPSNEPRALNSSRGSRAPRLRTGEA